MKKSLALLLALVMLIGVLAGCSANTDTTTTDSTTAAETAEPADTSAETDTTAVETEETAEPAAKTIETLKVAFVPSREPQEIITATEPLKQLLKDELAKEGYDVGEVEITVGTTYEAVGEGLEAGTIDVGLIPGGTYVLALEHRRLQLIHQPRPPYRPVHQPGALRADSSQRTGRRCRFPPAAP